MKQSSFHSLKVGYKQTESSMHEVVDTRCFHSLKVGYKRSGWGPVGIEGPGFHSLKVGYKPFEVHGDRVVGDMFSFLKGRI